MIKISKLNQAEYETLGIDNWPTWKKEVSEFDWYYECAEEFYLIEGLVSIYANGKVYQIKPGDYVQMPKGLQTDWKVISTVYKHYRFIEE